MSGRRRVRVVMPDRRRGCPRQCDKKQLGILLLFYDDNARSRLRPLPESPSNYFAAVPEAEAGVVDFCGTAVGGGQGRRDLAKTGESGGYA
jgi:hypothetical protein